MVFFLFLSISISFLDHIDRIFKTDVGGIIIKMWTFRNEPFTRSLPRYQRRFNSGIFAQAIFLVRISTARSCCLSSTATFNFQLLDKTSWLNLVHVTSFSFIQKCNCVYIRKNHVRVCCLLNCLAFNCFEVNSSLSSCLSSVFPRFSLVHCSPVAAVTKTAAKFVLLDLLAPNPASLLLIADLDSLARPLPMRRSRMLVFSTIAQVRDNLIRAHVTYFRLQRHYNALFFRDCFYFDVPTPITW